MDLDDLYDECADKVKNLSLSGKKQSESPIKNDDDDWGHMDLKPPQTSQFNRNSSPKKAIDVQWGEFLDSKHEETK